MKRRLITSLLIAFFSFSLSGCYNLSGIFSPPQPQSTQSQPVTKTEVSTNKGTNKVTVKEDLMDYINVELEKVAPLENEALTAYESVSGDNYTNDYVMYQAVFNTVIPKYEQFVNILESIKPQSQEVMDIHQEYVDGAKLQLEGFKLVAEALKKQDRSMVDTANSKLTQGTSHINQFISDLNELAKKNGVEIK